MKIGLVPMSAKPYHIGHHALAEMAASQNDRVILFVSLSDRKRKGQVPIMGSHMEDIWQTEIEPVLPPNVEVVYGGSPVRKVYEELERANVSNSDHIYRVYSDPVDTARNYPETNRIKNFRNLYQRGQVIFAAEENPSQFTRGAGTPNISGTAMRNALECGNKEEFKAGLPDGVDKERIYMMLCPLRQEHTLRHLIRSILAK